MERDRSRPVAAGEFCNRGPLGETPPAATADAAPAVAQESGAWTTLIEIDWVKRNAGRAGSFYAVKGGPNIDIPLFAHPPRAPLTPLTVPMPPQNKCCRDEAVWQDGWVAGWEAAHGSGGK